MDKNKRLQELQERLNYLTFREKECKWQEIQEIVEEMEQLSPSVEITEEEKQKSYAKFLKNMQQMKKNKSIERMRRIRNISIAATLFIVLVVVSAPTMIATREKEFFEIEFLNDKIKYMIYGSRDDNARTYKSYDELTNQVKKEIIVPSYVPDDMTLKEITDDDENLTIYYASGRKKLTMLITLKELEPYTDHAQIGGMDVTTWETAPRQHSARFKYGRYWYDVRGNVSLDEILKVVKGLERMV